MTEPSPTSPSAEPILAALQRFGQQVARRVWLEGAAFALPAVLLVLLAAAGVLAVEEPPGWARTAAAGLAVLVVVAAAAWAWRRAGELTAPTQLARVLEEREPSLRSDVRSSLDLAARTEPTMAEAAELRAALLVRIASRLTELEPRFGLWVPRRPLVRPLALAAGLALGGLVAAAALPDSFGVGLRRLVFGLPTAEELTLSIPIVATVDIEIVPPAYTGLKSERRLRTTGEVVAPAGAEIRLVFHLLTEASRATLKLDGPGEDVELSGTVRGNTAEFVFVATESATHQLTMYDAQGARIEDATRRRLIAFVDAPPKVELTEPVGDREVSNDEVVNFQYLATDEYGLKSIQLVWYFVDDPDHPRVVPLQPSLTERTFTEHVPFELGPLLLQPRDEVIVYIEAFDADTLTPNKSGRSRSVSLKVASQEEKSADLMRLKEELFEGLLREVGGLLELRAVTPERTAEGGLVLRPVVAPPLDLATRVGALQGSLPDWLNLVVALEALLKAVKEDERVPVSEVATIEGAHLRIYRAHLDLSRELERFPAYARGPAGARAPASAQVPPGQAPSGQVPAGQVTAGQLPGGPTGVDQASWEPVAARTAVLLTEGERAIVALSDLIALQKARDIEDTMEELGDIRERLSELLEQYRNSPDAATKEQIEREIRRLEQRMRELLQRLAEQGDKLPYEHLNLEALQDSEIQQNAMEMTSSLDDVRSMLDSGNIEGAIEALQQLGQALDQLQSEVSDPLQGAAPDTLSEFDQEMAALMDEVNNLEAMESDLEKATQEMFEQMRQRRQQEIADQVAETLAQAREQVQQLEREFAEAGNDQLTREAQQSTSELRQDLQRLEQHLERQDLTAAEQAAEQLMSRMADANQQLRREQALMARDPEGQRQASRNQQAAEQGQQTMEDIRGQMRRLMELSQPRPSAGEQAAMQQLGQQQQGISDRLNGLQSRIDQASGRFPMMQDQLGQPTQQVGESMNQSNQNLQGGRPQPALQGQRSALQGLQTMRQQMQQLTQRQRQQQNNGRSNSTERVEVPEDGDASRAQYRERVIDAMRDDTLEQYEQEIRRYYESLLQ
jgi:hypothetical protein